MGAPAQGIACIIGAEVLVIAVLRGDREALTQRTGVADGAGVAVITRLGIWGVDAAHIGVTGVVCAGVIVVTAELTRGGAHALSALVARGAWVSVIAEVAIGQVLAATIGVTHIIGAWVSIIAGQGDVALALAFDAGVNQCAGVPVIAGRDVGRMDAALGGLTGVVGADVEVVTDDGLCRHAVALLTDVSHRAGVLVIAGRAVRDMIAAHTAVAGVIGAWVGVIAIQDRLTGALPSSALVTQGAGVAVVARRGVGRMAAAADGVTGVIGAWVSVITAEVSGAWLTHPLPTGVP